jgi:hypothetical protein
MFALDTDGSPGVSVQALTASAKTESTGIARNPGGEDARYGASPKPGDWWDSSPASVVSVAMAVSASIVLNPRVSAPLRPDPKSQVALDGYPSS